MHTIRVILLNLRVNLIWRDRLVIIDSSERLKLCKRHQEISLDYVKTYLKISAVGMSEEDTKLVQVPVSCSIQSLLIHGRVLPPSGEQNEYSFNGIDANTGNHVRVW